MCMEEDIKTNFNVNFADKDIALRASLLDPRSLCKTAKYEASKCGRRDVMISHTCSSAANLINTLRRFVKSNQKQCHL